MVTEMLESYEREIHSIEGSLREAEENLENTRWVCEGEVGGREGRQKGLQVGRVTPTCPSATPP
jgi:hypothetical protein